MLNLSGKTALVTGASLGIGRASALALAQRGAQVLVHYGRGKVEAEAVAAEIRNAGGRAEVVASDLAAPDGAHNLARQARGIIGDRQTLPILGNGSSIVFLSSLAAHAVVGTLAAYAATKGAIDTLVKHFAAALAPRGIRVNAVAPGIVGTDMSNFSKTEAGQKYALSMQATQRLARPEDIGPVLAFLASDDARWITGDIVRVDGGSKL
jgi:NAD(P)-dependent dehydrogenase (short-subunit alcohol dehydrogenase family)